MNKGKLIVIEGGDGSGKSTQAKLLNEYLNKNNFSSEYFDFPRYYDSFYGNMVARFLRGEFGSIKEVSPYLASLIYALDRDSIKHKMIKILDQGVFIVANRYATSSMAHQGAKFPNNIKREEFINWLLDLEYKVNKIPKENLVILLYIPWRIALNLSNNQKNRKYLNGKKLDIHEEDLVYRRKVEKAYLELASRFGWVKINCVEKGKILTVKAIHQKIIRILKNKNVI